MGDAIEQYGNSTTGPHVPLTPTTRLIVQLVHFLVFFVCGWQIWVYVERVEALKKRIWSPYLLLLGFVVRSKQ